MGEGRTILFRCWDLTQKKWVKPRIEFIPHVSSDNYKEMYLEEEWTDDGPKENIVFQEWTGLKDKNGRMVFEGDIVSEPGYKDNFVFKFENGGNYYNDWMGFEMPSVEEFEVIGNIFENPEMLK